MKHAINKNQPPVKTESHLNSENIMEGKDIKDTIEIPKGKISPDVFNKIRRKLTQIKIKSSKNTGLIRSASRFIVLTIREGLSFTDTRIERFLNRVKHHPEPPKEERDFFDLLKGRLDVVFDVGARYDLYFYRIKPDCRYHLFEPNKKFTKILKEKIAGIRGHHITLNEFGLADRDADDCVYYKNSQSFEINPYLVEDTDSGERYSVRTLDGYIAEHNIARVDFLKIDTEGFDYKILLGGMKSIRENKIQYMQFEYWTGVKKFVDLLGDRYDLYFMMDPSHLKIIQETFYPSLSESQKKIDYAKSLVRLDRDIIDLIDYRLSPIGIGGNIFGVNKTIKDPKIEDLVFEIKAINASGKPQSPYLIQYRNLKKSLKDLFGHIGA